MQLDIAAMRHSINGQNNLCWGFEIISFVEQENLGQAAKPRISSRHERHAFLLLLNGRCDCLSWDEDLKTLAQQSELKHNIKPGETLGFGIHGLVFAACVLIHASVRSCNRS